MSSSAPTQQVHYDWRFPVGLALFAGGAGLLAQIPGVRDGVSRLMGSETFQRFVGDLASSAGRRGVSVAADLLS